MTTSVAPNADNTLTVPVRRLPLGVPIPTDVGPTRWKVWIPTAYGGLLTITHSGATQIDIQQPLGTSLGTGATDASTVVSFGDCWVLIAGGSGTLNATLVQKAWSRVDKGDPGAAPLLPYNFYYWPAEPSGTYAVQARNALRRYATAVGKDPAQADYWEVSNHEPAGSQSWVGHCHNAAPASAVFEPPQAQTINGQAFTEEEMEYLATEWYGSFGHGDEVWWIDSNDTKPAHEWDILAFLKPGGSRDRQAFIAGVGSFVDPALAVQKADGWVKEAGSEDEFIKNRKEGFGKNAAAFFRWIQKNLLLNSAPLLSNMRSYSGSGGANEVWNQVFFYYEATFAETWPNSPEQDDHDIKVSCNLYSNIDNYPSSGLPGTVTNNVVTPGTSSTDCWLYKHVYRIVFDDQGQPNEGDGRNEWVSVQNDKGEELYAPVYVSTIAPPGTTVDPSKTPFLAGNPALGPEFLSYVKLRARFQ